MDEDTSTASQQPQAEVVDSPAPVADAPATDVQQTTEPSEQSQDAPQADVQATDDIASAPQVDDKLQKYAKAQGLELDSPSAIKAAQIAMKNQAEATRNYQRSSELEKNTQITSDQLPSDATQQDVENARLRNIELQLSAANWKMNNPDKAAAEADMANLLVNDRNKASLVQQGLLSFDDLYVLATANKPANTDSVRTEAKRETLEQLAHNQQAAVPRGSATNPSVAPGEKPFNELSIEEMEKKLGFARR